MGPKRRKVKKIEPWYAKGLRFECTRCGNCCIGDGRYVFVYPGLDETFRIARHLGIAREDLIEGGACMIYPVRPGQCRTWPFWRSNLKRDEWHGFIKGRCPGIGRGRLYFREEIDEAAKEWTGVLDGASAEK